MFAFLILACIFVPWSLVYIYFKAFCISEKIAGDEKRVKVCDTFDLVNINVKIVRGNKLIMSHRFSSLKSFVWSP